jgi:hypothetical protein
VPRKRTESESKPESDFSGADLGVRSGRGPQSPSRPRESPIFFGLGSPSPRKSPICLWAPESESKGEFDLPLDSRVSESKGESDLLWTGEHDRVRVQGRVRSGRHLLRLDLLVIRPGFVWSVAEKGVVLME